MNLREAIISMMKGNKIRRKDWSPTGYLYFDKESDSICDDDLMHDATDYLYNSATTGISDEWEIFKE